MICLNCGSDNAIEEQRGGAFFVFCTKCGDEYYLPKTESRSNDLLLKEICSELKIDLGPKVANFRI